MRHDSLGKIYQTSYDKGHRHTVDIPSLGYTPRLSLDGLGQRDARTLPDLPGYVVEAKCEARVKEQADESKKMAYVLGIGGVVAGAVLGAVLTR